MHRLPPILLTLLLFSVARPAAAAQVVDLRADAGGKRFDGIGIVNGGGATSVLLKDYPEPQRSQILDMVFKPRFGASVSALLVEIPGDGNATQGSMPSHMHTRDDLNYSRGYTWWILQQSKARNPALSLDGAAWSAPGWVGNGNFWSQDAADYDVKWLTGLRQVYGLEFDALGCRNEKGVSLPFAKMLRATLNAHGFGNVKIHAFDNWTPDKFDWVQGMVNDPTLRDSIDIISGHTLLETPPSPQVQAIADRLNKSIWNTEEHVYKKAFDCEIGIVQAFNENFIRGKATRTVNWYDIAALYPMEPYSQDPSMLLAQWPWSGHYEVREALWGYAHYGQFAQVGWQYLNGGCGELADGGSYVTLKSPGDDYTVIIETSHAKVSQSLTLHIGDGLSHHPLCVWRSNASEQFVRQPPIDTTNGTVTLTLDANSIYSLSTTTGQQKGSFPNIPAARPFPFPYYETFDEYASPKQWGYLPRYTADIADAFEIAGRPDGKGKCLRQVVPTPTISWTPDWQPLTILGDQQWRDYEFSADVYLNPHESAAIMGRVSSVGTGYGFIPKGYFLRLNDTGRCDLVVIRGKRNRKSPVGDAEQQALIKVGADTGEGGEKVLGTVQLQHVGPNQWHTLKLRFQGSSITGWFDGTQVITATDTLYAHGMAGLMTGGGKILSTSYFDNLLITAPDAPAPKASDPLANQLPIYR